jgi:hypothetical protein
LVEWRLVKSEQMTEDWSEQFDYLSDNMLVSENARMSILLEPNRASC